MKKIAVFGKPGSGKSTLSMVLAARTGIPYHPLDSLVYQPDGSQIPRAQFDQLHDDIVQQESWIIDGLGPLASFHARLKHADVWVYINLPYWLSYYLVSKRLLKGLFITPKGWPKGSSIIKGSWQSYKMLRLSPTFWHDEFEQQLIEQAKTQGAQLYVLTSLAEVKRFVTRFESQS